MKYAGFWKRLAAFIIDGMILSVVTSLIVMGMAGIDESVAELAGNLLGVVIFWMYYAGMESSSKQATLGKILFEMKVTDIDGNSVSFLRATGRFFAKIISGFILGIGYLMVAFTKKKQGLHDMIAGCLVIKAEKTRKTLM